MKSTQVAPPTHIIREKNRVADALSKIGLAAIDFGTTNILYSPPPTVEALVQENKLGFSFVRSKNLKFINLVYWDMATGNLITNSMPVLGNNYADPRNFNP